MAERRRIVWGASTKAPQTPDQRAEELLLSILTPEERAYYKRTGRVAIRGSNGGEYEIRTDHCSGNIRPLNRVWVSAPYGNPVRARPVGPDNLLCAHPRLDIYEQRGDDRLWTARLPMLDAIATQILTIKADEKHFLRTALVYL